TCSSPLRRHSTCSLRSSAASLEASFPSTRLASAEKMSAAAIHSMGGVNALPIFDRLTRGVMEATTPHANDDPQERRAIDAIKRGHRSAYDYLVAKYTKRVVSIAWNIVRNPHDAEDLAQEAFVKAFESIGRFRSGEPFGPWIYRIVTNLSLDVVKHRSRFRHEELASTEPAA